jgi:hypothetical protein
VYTQVEALKTSEQEPNKQVGLLKEDLDAGV